MGCGASNQRHVAAPVRIPGNTVSAHYAFGPVIGRGQFAVVRSCEHKVTGDKVAIKSFKRSNVNYDLGLIREEIEALKLVKHPGCIELLETFKGEDGLHLVLERGLGGDLWGRIADLGPIPKDKALNVTRQILEALAYMHEQNICHRDLNPNNVILMGNTPKHPEYWTAKLADFGFASRKMQGYFNTMHTVLGTPEFSAPELLKMMVSEHSATMSGFAQPTRYNAKVDVWGVGAILFTMIAGEVPFVFGDNLPVMIQRVLHGAADFDTRVWTRAKSRVKEFVQLLMSVEVRDRPRAREALEHPCLSSAGDRSPSPEQGAKTLKRQPSRKAVEEAAVSTTRMAGELLADDIPELKIAEVVKPSSTGKGQMDVISGTWTDLPSYRNTIYAAGLDPNDKICELDAVQSHSTS